MKIFTKNSHLVDIRWTMPVSAGMIIAIASAFILRQSLIWAALITMGLFVGVLSLTARNFRSYWLGIFALTLPLEIKKLFIDSDYIREIIRLNNIPVGELPGPVLYLADLPFIVLMLYWLFEITYKKERVFFPKSNWMALSFVAWAGLSMIKAPLFSYAFFELLRIIKFYLIYLYIANNLRSKSEVKTLMTCFLVGVAFQGSICLYQYVSQDISHIFGDLFGKQDLYSQEGIEKYQTLFSVYGSWGDTLRRASGTVGPINAEAQYFEFLLPVALILWLTARRFWNQSFKLSIFFIGLAGLIVTFSRGGLIGLMAGIFVVLIYAKTCKLISNKKLLTIVVICLIVGTALIPIFYQYMMTRPEAAFARFHLMKVALSMIQEHPVMGVGLNNHLIVAPEFDPDTYLLAMPTHNHYLIVASEIGIPGLVFFLGFISITCMTILKSTRSNDLYIAALAVGILGAYAAISVHILVDWLASNTNQTFFWLYGGMAAALYRLNKIKGCEDKNQSGCMPVDRSHRMI
jgi:hypothetical protein